MKLIPTIKPIPFDVMKSIPPVVWIVAAVVLPQMISDLATLKPQQMYWRWVLTGVIALLKVGMDYVTHIPAKPDSLTETSSPAIPKWKEVITMPLAITCDNLSKVPVAITGKKGDVEVPLGGPVTVAVQSGDGSVESTGDASFNAVSGSALGDTVFALTDAADNLVDTVTLTVTAPKPDSLVETAGSPVAK
jgi:hypothetical protein